MFKESLGLSLSLVQHLRCFFASLSLPLSKAVRDWAKLDVSMLFPRNNKTRRRRRVWMPRKAGEGHYTRPGFSAVGTKNTARVWDRQRKRKATPGRPGRKRGSHSGHGRSTVAGFWLNQERRPKVESHVAHRV